VYWDGRLVGHLRDIVLDQPYYHGAWTSTGDSDFERAFAALQARMAPDGLGMIPVTLWSSDGSVSAPVAAMVRPDMADPYFRFGDSDLLVFAVHEPRRKPAPRECASCCKPISAERLRAMSDATQCWDCQTGFERARR
jgi:hypothetical protein